MTWAIVASVAATVISGAMQSDSAGDAADLQAEGTRSATAENRRQFDLVRQDQFPFREGGVAAMQKLRNFMGIGPDQGAVSLIGRDTRGPSFNPALLKDPEYLAAWYGLFGGPEQGDSRTFAPEDLEATLRAALPQEYLKRLEGEKPALTGDAGLMDRRFSVEDFWADPVTKLGLQTGLDLGTKALRNAAPLTTGMDSGAALKELTKFGTDYTGMKAAESEGRFEGNKSNVFNRLMAMIGGGQVANQVNAAAGTNFANTNANLVTAGANAQGAARIAGGNAWSNGIGNLSNWWQQKSMIDRIFPQKTGGGSSAIGGWAGIPAEYDYGYGGT